MAAFPGQEDTRGGTKGCTSCFPKSTSSAWLPTPRLERHCLLGAAWFSSVSFAVAAPPIVVAPCCLGEGFFFAGCSRSLFSFHGLPASAAFQAASSRCCVIVVLRRLLFLHSWLTNTLALWVRCFPLRVHDAASRLASIAPFRGTAPAQCASPPKAAASRLTCVFVAANCGRFLALCNCLWLLLRHVAPARVVFRAAAYGWALTGCYPHRAGQRCPMWLSLVPWPILRSCPRPTPFVVDFLFSFRQQRCLGALAAVQESDSTSDGTLTGETKKTRGETSHQRALHWEGIQGNT